MSKEKDFVLLPHYSGNPVGHNGEGLSCDQFCAIVDNQIETFKWTAQDAFKHALQALTGEAFEWAKSNSDDNGITTWPSFKMAIKAKFKRHVTIQMKADLRKSLKQSEDEGIREFYSRCKEAERLICDEQTDNSAFERDAVLTFLIGLREDLQLKVMHSDGFNFEDFLEEALKTEDLKSELPELDPMDLNDLADLNNDEDTEDDNDFSKDYLPDEDLENDLDDKEDLDDLDDKLDAKKENVVKKVPLACTHCEMPFKTEKLLKSHIKSEHSESKNETEKLKCSTCSATFRTSRMLRLHISKSHSENSQYSCQNCAQDFYDLKKFILHQIKFHAERNGDQILCLACHKPYTKSHSLQVHMIRKHYKEKPFPCDQCDKKFFTITDAQKHIKIVHLNEKPFACEKCGKQYSTSGGLLIHNRSAHGDQGEWLQCDQCDKKFAYKQILQAHILNNHDKGNFMCDECGVPYNTKSTLRQHKMAVHPSTNGGQTYPCLHTGCSRVFKVAAKLRMHDDVVHKNLEGKYKCSYCPKRFWGKSSLREHTNGVHLNTKPHKCTHCEFSSAYRNILREHIRATHEQRKFSCPMCNHKSSYKNNLEKHIKNVHSSAKKANSSANNNPVMQQQLPQQQQQQQQPQPLC